MSAIATGNQLLAILSYHWTLKHWNEIYYICQSDVPLWRLYVSVTLEYFFIYMVIKLLIKTKCYLLKSKHFKLV